jgi:hypothetical protein
VAPEPLRGALGAQVRRISAPARGGVAWAPCAGGHGALGRARAEGGGSRSWPFLEEVAEDQGAKGVDRLELAPEGEIISR